MSFTLVKYCPALKEILILEERGKNVMRLWPNVKSSLRKYRLNLAKFSFSPELSVLGARRDFEPGNFEAITEIVVNFSHQPLRSHSVSATNWRQFSPTCPSIYSNCAIFVSRRRRREDVMRRNFEKYGFLRRLFAQRKRGTPFVLAKISRHPPPDGGFRINSFPLLLEPERKRISFGG